jgi:O-antigen ligase
MFGAVHTYMYTLVTLGVLSATVLLVIKSIRKDYKTGKYRFEVPRNSLHVGFAVFLGFLVLQIVPLPSFLLDPISPVASVVAEKSLPAEEMVNSDEMERPWFSLAAYGYPVRMSAVRFLVYGLFFFGFLQTLQSRRRINVAVSFLLAMGCFEALYGLMETYSGSHHVLWYQMDYAKERVKGTFINGNHFAAFMAMGVVLAAAFAGAISPEKRVSRKNSRRKPDLNSRVVSFLEGEEALFKRILVGLSGVVMGIGLIFSASRGAILSWAGAMFLMGLLLVLRKKYRRKGVLFIGIFVLICGYAVQIGVEYPLERFMKMESGIESRSRYAARTMDLFKDFQVAGVGIGNFQYAFPKYQSERDKKKYYIFAHNDWAQYMAEAGIVGLGLLLGGVGYYLFKTLKLWAGRKDAYAVCLGVAPVVCLGYIGLHSYGEFSLHTPANMLILLAVMAIGYAVLHLERHHRRDVMTYRYYDLPLKYRGGVLLVLVLGLVGWTGYTSICHFMAEVNCNTVPNSTLNRDLHPPEGELAAAIGWDQGNAVYWYKLAESLAQSEERLANDRISEGEKRKALEKAVGLNPFEARYHLRLGWEYAHLWKKKDYHTKWLPAADISMDRAAYFAGVKNPHLHQELGNYWTMRSRTVLPNNPIYHEAWAKACRHYRKAQSLETGGVLKRMKKEIREYVWHFYPDEQYIEQVMN